MFDDTGSFESANLSFAQQDSTKSAVPLGLIAGVTAETLPGTGGPGRQSLFVPLYFGPAGTKAAWTSRVNNVTLWQVDDVMPGAKPNDGSIASWLV